MKNTVRFYTEEELNELTEIAKLPFGHSKARVYEFVKKSNRKKGGVEAKLSEIRRKTGNLVHPHTKKNAQKTMFPVVPGIPTAISRTSEPAVTVNRTEVRLGFKSMTVDFETKELILAF